MSSDETPKPNKLLNFAQNIALSSKRSNDTDDSEGIHMFQAVMERRTYDEKLKAM
jgi:hypothetical protein